MDTILGGHVKLALEFVKGVEKALCSHIGGHICSSIAVNADEVRSKHKDFICRQLREIIRRICRAFDSVEFFHSNAYLAKRKRTANELKRIGEI